MKKMEHIIKIVKLLEESVLLMKAIRETIKRKAKKQKSEFLPIFSWNVMSILGNALSGRRVIRADEGVIRARQNF